MVRNRDGFSDRSVFGLTVMLARDKDCKDLGDGISDRKVFAENERHKRNVRKTAKGL